MLHVLLRIRCYLTCILITASLSGYASEPMLPTSIALVNGHHIEYAMTRHDGPTVVFVHGVGSDLNRWSKVYPAIAATASSFAYSRAGYGNSDTLPSAPTGMAAVDELRALLNKVGLKPPYILVGHSLGGLYTQLYARAYPSEVSGLILVDSVYPDAGDFISPDVAPWWLRAGTWLFTSRTSYQEILGIKETAASVSALPSFGGRNVIVLQASRPLIENVGEPKNYVANLFPGAKAVTIQGGHDIPVDKPGAVIGAIREILAHGPSVARTEPHSL